MERADLAEWTVPQDQPVLAVQAVHSCLPPWTGRSATATKKRPDHWGT
jgi:hypothetical protein